MNKHLEPVNGSTTSPFDAIKRTTSDRQEYWSARDLMPLMGYARWEDFLKITRRAEASARNSGQGGFSEITEKLSDGGRPRTDFHLSRFAAYLVAMNGDPNKPEVAAAQAYFAIQTHVAETTKSPAELTRREILTMALEAEERAELAEKQAAEQESIARQQTKRLELAAPKVAKADAHTAATEWKGRQEFAREVQHWGRQWGHNINQESVYELLRRKGMLVSGNRRDRNHATAQAEKTGWATTAKGVSETTGKPWAAARISPRGQDVAWKWITKAIEQYGPQLNPGKEAA